MRSRNFIALFGVLTSFGLPLGAQGSQASHWTRLQVGLSESAVQEQLGAPSRRRTVAGLEVLEFEGSPSIRLEMEGGKLKTGMLEFERSVDPSQFFSPDTPAIQVEGVALSESPDLKIQRKYLDLVSYGVRIEVYRGRSNRMWLIPKDTESRERRPRPIKTGPLKHWLVKTLRRPK